MQNTNQDVIFFWQECAEYGIFSNWYPASFVIDDFQYLHVEQYMMAQKAKLFHDAKRYTAILRANTPKECKALGREVSPFDARVWDAARYEVVKAGNRAKFSQNPALWRALLDTGDCILAEASPFDGIWGIQMDASAAAQTNPSLWPGKNLLGKVLMELRAEFRSRRPATIQLRMMQGDITQIQDVDAIVNAANNSLLGGGGVDGAIHRAAGPALLAECRTLHGCATGQAKITRGYRLPCRFVIHTVGPIWSGGQHGEAKLLADCYRNSLQLAVDNGIRRIAFPSISTGVYAFPVKPAAEIAVRTVRAFADAHPDALDLVEWVLFDDRTFQVYTDALNKQS